MTKRNLPSQSTPFIGREQELADIAGLLNNLACRLLTLVGPGGIGKTRLALQAAGQETAYSDGIYFVALQPLTSSEFIIPTLANVINLQFYPGGDPRQQLLDYLCTKAILLIMDNCEHLLDGVGLISDVLAAAPSVKVLVTSRERLSLLEEWVFELQGLAVPPAEDTSEIETYSAAQLFLQNAQRVNVGFKLTASQQPAMAHICRMVGGMPLGIELAAAWVRALSCEQIAAELERSLDILETPARNVPPRHRNMRAAFEPTWQRLPEAEREVFKKLSVFRGGFTPEAGQAVAGASLRILSSLVDKSLLRANADGRYDLHELLRQYGEEQLNAVAEESQQIHDLHCAYYAKFVHQRWEEMLGPQMKQAVEAVAAVLENVQAAWAWAVSRVKREELWKFISGLQQFFLLRSRFQEAVITYAQAVDGLEFGESQNENSALLGSILANHAFFCGQVGLNENSDESHRKSLALLSRLDDLAARRETVEALWILAWTSREMRPLEAKRLSQESVAIARTRGYRRELEWALMVLASIDLWVLGDYVEGKRTSEEAFELAGQFGHPMGMALCCYLLGQVAFSEGRYTEAKRLQWKSYRILKDLDSKYTLISLLLHLGDIALAEQDYPEARRLYQEALVITQESFPGNFIQIPLVGIVDLLLKEGDRERAVELSAFVLDQPDLFAFNAKGRASRLLQKLEAELSPEVFAAAVERGKARKFDETVNELLAELSQPDEEALRLDRKTLTQPLLDPLSQRELEVLRLIGEGLTNGDIAARLVIAVGTVKAHTKNIYDKLTVHTRTQAVARARKLKLL